MASARTQLLPHKSQPRTHRRWRQAKQTPVEAQTLMSESRGKRLHKGNGERCGSHLLTVKCPRCSSVLREDILQATVGKALWEGQCQPRQCHWHQLQQSGTNCSCVRTRQWWFPVSDQCRSYPCPGLANLPESWPESHSTSAAITSHPLANHQNNAKLQLKQFRWWSRVCIF